MIFFVANPNAPYDQKNSKIKIFLSGQRERLLGGLEHILGSVFSLFGLIVFSRLLSIEQFGALALAIGIWLIVEMLQNSLIINPFIVSCPLPEKNQAEFGAWLAWNFVLAISTAAILVIFGLILRPILPWFSEAMVLSGPLSFAGMHYMFARRVHYHRRNQHALLAQTALFCTCYVISIAVIIYTEVPVNPISAASALALAYALPGLAYNTYIARSVILKWNFLSHIKQSRKLVIELGIAGVIWQLSYSTSLVVLGLLGSPGAVAIFSATRTLVRPVTLLISTLVNVEISRASRSYQKEGKHGLARVVHRLSWISASAASVPLGLLLCFPVYFLSVIYGEQYVFATLELQLRALLFLPLVFLAPLDIGLTVLRDTKFLMLAHFVSFVVGITALIAFWLLFEINATTALASLIFARLVSMPLLYIRFHRLMNSPKHCSPATISEMADAR